MKQSLAGDPHAPFSHDFGKLSNSPFERVGHGRRSTRKTTPRKTKRVPTIFGHRTSCVSSVFRRAHDLPGKIPRVQLPHLVRARTFFTLIKDRYAISDKGNCEPVIPTMQRPIPASTNNILEGHLQGLYYSTLSNLLAFQHCLTVCTVWSEGLLNVKKKIQKGHCLLPHSRVLALIICRALTHHLVHRLRFVVSRRLTWRNQTRRSECVLIAGKIEHTVLID